MKKIFLFLLFSLPLISVFAQVPQVDSLNRLLAHTKEDTIKVMAFAKLSFYEPSFEHGMKLARAGLDIALKIKYKRGEAACLHQIGNHYKHINNYPLALDYYLEALKIRETLKSKEDIASSYYTIGSIYAGQGDNKNAISYYQKAESLHSLDNYNFAMLNCALGLIYEQLKMLDSASKYFQRSNEYINSSNNKFQLNTILTGLGRIQLEMKHSDLALGYYKEAIQNGNTYNDTSGLAATYLCIARLYAKSGKEDSCMSYAEKSLFCAQRINNLASIIGSGNLLSILYENINDKEALRYLQIVLQAKDSLYSKEKALQIQNMLLNESERQSELAEKEKKDIAEKKLNIQYILITLGIIILLILYLLLSRSFITNTKLIKFFGIIALLIVFEFLNLLLHPFIERITGHSPMLTLLALVCIASLLVPLHHKVEKWTTTKLVEKNKQIRLAAARKTIQELDKD